MQIGKVIGNLWATKKEESLNGMKLLIVAPLNVKDNSEGLPIVVGDLVGAGIGETVIWVQGSMARYSTSHTNITIDAVIVGIVDGIEIDKS